VIGHTGLAEIGKSSQMQLAVPAQKGRYPFICSVSGHYTVSKGVLVVE